jgi:hypothetical protein
MKNVGRRLFARATMGVPLALNSYRNGVASAPPPPPSFVAGGIGMGALESAKNAPSFMDKVYRALRVETQVDQNVESFRNIRRHAMGGLDPDLAVLNSMSTARRVQIQIDREKAHRDKMQGIRARIIKSLGGDPEEYEGWL